MTMTDDQTVRDRFLQAEAEASEMIDALKGLRAEMEQHRTTRESLEDAVDATRRLSAGMEPIATRMQGLLQSLEELGFTAFREDLSEVRNATERIRQEMLTEGAFKAAAESRHEDLSQKVEALTKVVSRVGATVDRSSETMSDAMDRHHSWTMGMLIAVVVLVVATLVIGLR